MQIALASELAMRVFSPRALLAALPYWRRKMTPGICPICEARTMWVRTGDWLRDQLLCVWCGSIPRFRAVIIVLEEYAPNWRSLAIHESSPGSSSSKKIARECAGYESTQFWPNVLPGQCGPTGTRCENLERQTFTDESFDLVLTQDVFEHVLDPGPAFREIARTLKPGGAHIFTVPWYFPKPTRVRAIPDGDSVRHLCDPDYHCNPVDPKGSLVVTEWGVEMPDFILRHSGMATVAIRLFDPSRGIEGDFREVFISVKPA